MDDKKKLLDIAFDNAANREGMISLDPAVAKKSIKVSMEEFSRKKGYPFSEKDIDETIKRNYEDISHSGMHFE